MLRYVLLLLPAVALLSCGNECRTVNDCTSPKVCYRGTCRTAIDPRFVQKGELTCLSDTDCPVDSANPMSNAYECIAGRCLFCFTSTSAGSATSSVCLH